MRRSVHDQFKKHIYGGTIFIAHPKRAARHLYEREDMKDAGLSRRVVELTSHVGEGEAALSPPFQVAPTSSPRLHRDYFQRRTLGTSTGPPTIKLPDK